METLRYVVLVNGLLAVVSVAYYVLLRRETFFRANRLVLWLGVLSALLLPLLELPDWRPQPVRTAMQQTAQAIVPRVLPPTASPAEVTITFPNQRTYRAFQTQQNRFVWSWPMGLLLLYMAGVIVLMARFGIQLLSLRKLIRRSEHELYDNFVLVRNETVTSPFSFFKWVVLNPTRHTTDELDQILRHERVHVREQHSVDMLAVELVCIVFWFNPAAYLFRHLIHQILEFSADRAVLAEGIDAKAYQYNLLKVSLSAGQSTLTNHFSKSQLKSRIAMLNQPNSPTISWLKYPIFLLAALTVASAFARPQPIEVLSKYVAKPVVDALEEVVVRAKKPNLAVLEKKLAGVNNQSMKMDTQTYSNNNLTTILKNSTESIPTLTANTHSSVHTELRDNTLFWVITPLSTFEDIVQLKAEVAGYGYTFDIDELKFDMLHKFLVRLDATMTSLNAQGRRTTDEVEVNKPMKSFGGQISILKPGVLGVNELGTNSTYPTKTLMAKALADEQNAQRLLEDNRLDYMIAEGLALTKDNWVTKRYSADEIVSNQAVIQTQTGLSFAKTDQLTTSNRENRSYWLNNHPITSSELRNISLTQIYSVITRDKFIDNNQTTQQIVLIYTTL
jgi:beta-lactamase regulating signal transducer with metallopeptidase domain